ncbi:MAG TPA: NAD(P) transhydrogenase subunit alpha [Candidatus Dormibacteraeota bacterium]|jgi:NAD(P) transhydrogenase subunit alpha|nr:NAD(P) transhydrogenase subunit alpha [Candidatus Dormibacteraeota bacterium]
MRAATSGPTRRLAVVAIKETAPGERRVALAPDAVGRLEAAGLDVLVEAGAGTEARFSDDVYVEAGASIVSGAEVTAADLVVTVGTLSPAQVDRLRPGQTVIGMLRPLVAPQLARQLAERGVTAISLDGMPRTVARAQTMDVLTSQANVAGYKAALVAADAFGRYFPLMITAAGTAKPADVLVLGAGVAGLQAMGTANRLGAVVTGYDVRPQTRGEIESVGARILQLQSVGPAPGEGGYARALTESEQAAQREELDAHLARFDVVITTAQVPGRRPPRLVTAEAVARMRAGSVVVDLGASALGGNVEGSVPDQTILTGNAVTIIGAGNLAAQLPTAASAAFSHNITALLLDLVHDGALVIDPEDEIQAGIVVTHGGQVIHPAVLRLLDAPSSPGAPGGNP